MRTKLNVDNPYGYNRYGFAWEHVPEGGAAHLDFGCGDGRFLAALKTKGTSRLVGVDVHREAVEKCRQQFGEPEFLHISQAGALPFADGEFSSVTALDVIEHIDRQEAVLAELNRVLRRDGVLIVTVPGRHLFSCLDAGNLKFRFPRLHRRHYCRKHSKTEYEQKYVSNPDGLVGDVSARKRWHEHFSRKKLAAILEQCGFEVVGFDGSGFFYRVIKGVSFLVGRPRALQSFFARIEAIDARLFESANVFCVARKR